ncbi:MAG: acyl-CoA dehydrogenase family protein [Bacillota bacterium]|nr:acyl-CoA dehydrogenase family protein [Bacillota bacterium]
MDFGFTKEQKLIQNAFNEFSQKYIEPRAEEIDHSNVIPNEIMAGLAELDMFGIPFSSAYGGADGGFLNYVLALEQVAAASGGIATVLGAHVLSTNAISRWGTEELKQQYMPACCNGEHIASFAFTEPQTGSDPKQITSTAVRQGDHYILNGTKRFITNASYPGPLVCFARENESGEITAFIVDKFCDGYTVSKPWEKIGMHGYPLLDIYLKDVKVPVENVLGEVGKGFAILTTGICFGRVGVTTTSLGSMLGAYREAVKYSKERTHRDKAIGKFQQIQLQIADIAATYEACKWMTYHIGHVANTFKDETELAREVSLAKNYVCEAAVDVARKSLNVHGSYGLTNDYKISRIYRDAIVSPQIEGVTNMQKIIAASTILR